MNAVSGRRRDPEWRRDMTSTFGWHQRAVPLPGLDSLYAMPADASLSKGGDDEHATTPVFAARPPGSVGHRPGLPPPAPVTGDRRPANPDGNTYNQTPRVLTPVT